MCQAESSAGNDDHKRYLLLIPPLSGHIGNWQFSEGDLLGDPAIIAESALANESGQIVTFLFRAKSL